MTLDCMAYTHQAISRSSSKCAARASSKQFVGVNGAITAARSTTRPGYPGNQPITSSFNTMHSQHSTH